MAYSGESVSTRYLTVSASGSHDLQYISYTMGFLETRT